MTTQAMEKRNVEVRRAERLRSGRTFLPNVDIVEKDEELLVVVDMPGVKADGVEVQYERGLLTVHGTVPPRQDPEKTNYLLREYGVGDFHRCFEVGEGIDAGRIEAELRDGVLTIHLPKVKEVVPRKIQVKSA